jgi:hypothetical protein
MASCQADSRVASVGGAGAAWLACTVGPGHGCTGAGDPGWPLFILPLTGCGGSTVNGPGRGDSSPLAVSSPDLPGGRFPREFTCDGANRRPRLEWSTPPPGTQELVIEMLDPDAQGGTFTH